MGHSLGDSLIVASLAALFFGYLYLNHRARIRRLELIHQERQLAIEKDFPLPELPVDPPPSRMPPDPNVLLILGVVLLTFGTGSMIALRSFAEPAAQRLWVMPLPIAFMGLGLVVVHRLIQSRGA